MNTQALIDLRETNVRKLSLSNFASILLAEIGEETDLERSEESFRYNSSFR